MAEKKKDPGMPKGTPTYPLSPRTMEVIVHAAHNGENWIDMPKDAGKGEKIPKTGINLLHHIGRLETSATNIKDRSITIHATAAQADTLETIAHKMIIYMPNGKTLPSVVDHTGWIASKSTDDPHFERKCQLTRPGI